MRAAFNLLKNATRAELIDGIIIAIGIPAGIYCTGLLIVAFS